MKRTAVASAVVLVVVLVLTWLAWLSLKTVENRNLAAWNAWVNQVFIACQGRSDVAAVERLLGEPKWVESPGDIRERIIRRVPASKQAEEVYVYSHFCRSFRGYWEAYVFVGPNDEVVGCHVFHPSDGE